MQPWFVKLSDLKAYLKTGDVILVHGRYPFSVVIEAFQWSPWSHSAMIVRPEDIGLENQTDELLLWEANDLTNLPDFVTGKTKTGPMLVSFEERVKSTQREFNSVQFACRHLYVERTPVMMNNLKKFMNEVINAGFPDSSVMARMLIEGRYSRKDSGNALFFCSELLAASYQTMKLLDDYYPKNAYEPKDFSQTGTIPLLQRAFLGNEMHFNPLV